MRGMGDDHPAAGTLIDGACDVVLYSTLYHFTDPSKCRFDNKMSESGLSLLAATFGASPQRIMTPCGKATS